MSKIPMKVLFISKRDFANVGYLLAKSLNSIGVVARSVCLRESNIGLVPDRGYGCSEVVTIQRLKRIILNYDVIQFMHSSLIKTKVNLSRKLVSVFHGGSDYRKKPISISRKWNRIARFQLVQTGDLLNRGKVNNEEWLLPPVDTDYLFFENKINELRQVLHCPSNFEKKGTSQFITTMTELEKSIPNFRWSVGDRVNWYTNIDRIRDCDIYFDACQPILRGKPYGFWGMAALEAAALGKVVITHFNHNEKRYIKLYGKHPLQVANNFNEVKERIIECLTMNETDLKNLQSKTRQWVVKNHSLKVVGKRLRDIYRRYI